jgi:cysteine desulfurase/selenocysteine lyase
MGAQSQFQAPGACIPVHYAACQYEEMLLAYAHKAISEIPGLRFVGTAPNKVSVLSFVLDGISNEDLGRRLNQDGIAVRAGHHCAQPVLRRFGVGKYGATIVGVLQHS